MTEKLKQRFCKDQNLPIKVFRDDIFYKRLELFDQFIPCIGSYNKFLETVEKCGGEVGYFEHYNKVKDDAIEYLNNNEAMKNFLSTDMNKFACAFQGLPTKDIFKTTFNGFTFLSIDMKKANFTALHHFDANIVGNKDSYEDFIGMFTDIDYIKSSKYIRQVIFGNVNPKRQITYEKYLMSLVLSELFVYFKTEDIVFFSTDEIVVLLNNYLDKIDEVISFVNNVVNKSIANKINVRAEYFALRKIEGTDGFIKDFLYTKNGFDFKCINSLEYPFVFRYLKNELPQPEDFVFLFEDKYAKLLEPINISII